MKKAMRLTTAMAAVMVAAACATPTNPGKGRPVMSGPVATGPGSLESVRRQFEGTWRLVALQSSPKAGAPLAPVQAEGTLVYDQYGGLTIDARTTDAAAPAAARDAALLSFKGRAVIDTAKSELALTDVAGNVDPGAVLSPERRRRYAFDGDTLTLSSMDAAGNITATAVWRKQP